MTQILQAHQHSSLYESGMTLDRRIESAHRGLETLLDELVGGGVLLDVSQLRRLAKYLERTAIPVAEAYERFLVENPPWGCPNCGCDMAAHAGACRCPCHP
jgi:hypothetical protein